MALAVLGAGWTIRAVALDCDGVILESVQCKADAFRRLFAAWPEHLEAIEAFHYANGGMSRYEKLDRIYREILHRPLDEQARQHLAEAFSRHVLDEILTCDLVAGAYEMLTHLHGRLPLSVVSATPEEELREILELRKLAHYFESLFGYPVNKVGALQQIRRAEGIDFDELLFVGDARVDLDAAEQVGCRFVGRVPRDRSNPFEGRCVPIVSDCLALDAWLAPANRS